MAKSCCCCRFCMCGHYLHTDLLPPNHALLVILPHVYSAEDDEHEGRVCLPPPRRVCRLITQCGVSVLYLHTEEQVLDYLLHRSRTTPASAASSFVLSGTNPTVTLWQVPATTTTTHNDNDGVAVGPRPPRPTSIYCCELA